MGTATVNHAALEVKTARLVFTSVLASYGLVISLVDLLVFYFTGMAVTNNPVNTVFLALNLFVLMASIAELAFAWVVLGKLRDYIPA